MGFLAILVVLVGVILGVWFLFGIVFRSRSPQIEAQQEGLSAEDERFSDPIISGEVLVKASYSGDIGLVEKALSMGANPNTRYGPQKNTANFQ